MSERKVDPIMRFPPARRRAVSQGSSRSNDATLTPVARSRDGRAHTANVHLEELSLLPLKRRREAKSALARHRVSQCAETTYGDVSDTSGIACNVEYHSGKDDRREGRVESDSVVRQVSSRVEGEEVESDRGEDKSGSHARNSPAGNATTSSAVDDGERDEGEDKAVMGRESGSAP